ncbi:Gfo/Idh/MocA family oxidoreductase [Paenibacillus allorhizosphaerae]|uniref:Myo-inositol 2-dehydrogenase n=1 Tax=Paenibacillus allorhizosphaerae TaxID=2849866 RepID=A0ABM8VLW6_9BACL|nr:Gfo/Idh/MocA family oxidoreductase [Paenibacillus allorhizosphaerae]CAG7649110.1 Myo-inositol 2-dehydrogenase [Paenibacillus allorhizosphaerae]
MKVGVVGTGSMGKNHARVYSSLHDYCQLAGVFDTDYKRACDVAEQSGGEAFRSLQDLLKKVDAVSVVVPTPAHFQVGLACVNQSVHVFMEKPITETVAQAKKLIVSASDNEVVLQVGHIELFNPTVAVLKDLIKNEEVVSIEMHRLSPLEQRMIHADVVSDLMIHDIYILFELLGNRVKQYFALGKQVDSRIKHAEALLKLESGTVAGITASHLYNEKVRTIRVVTSSCIIVADLLNRTVRKSSLWKPGDSESVAVPDADPLKLGLIHFIESIHNKQKPKVTGEDGLAALSLVNKIRRKISASL